MDYDLIIALAQAMFIIAPGRALICRSTYVPRFSSGITVAGMLMISYAFVMTGFTAAAATLLINAGLQLLLFVYRGTRKWPR